VNSAVGLSACVRLSKAGGTTVRAEQGNMKGSCMTLRSSRSFFAFNSRVSARSAAAALCVSTCASYRRIYAKQAYSCMQPLQWQGPGLCFTSAYIPLVACILNFKTLPAATSLHAALQLRSRTHYIRYVVRFPSLSLLVLLLHLIDLQHHPAPQNDAQHHSMSVGGASQQVSKTAAAQH
jgi:hypothetical protein